MRSGKQAQGYRPLSVDPRADCANGCEGHHEQNTQHDRVFDQRRTAFVGKTSRRKLIIRETKAASSAFKKKSTSKASL